MIEIALPSPTSADRNRLANLQAIRRRALDRLYQRREAVDDLIQSLEVYLKSKESRRAQCIEFVSARRCS